MLWAGFCTSGYTTPHHQDDLLPEELSDRTLVLHSAPPSSAILNRVSCVTNSLLLYLPLIRGCSLKENKLGTQRIPNELAQFWTHVSWVCVVIVI